MMKEYLLTNLDKLHTTDFEEVRLQKNLLLREENPVVWVKGFIQRSETTIRLMERIFMWLMTISASSCVIITGHKKVKKVGI